MAEAVAAALANARLSTSFRFRLGSVASSFVRVWGLRYQGSLKHFSWMGVRLNAESSSDGLPYDVLLLVRG